MTMDTHVNACLHANTYTLNQVSDVFTMAQRLVVYPFWPLFDVGSTDLTPKARDRLYVYVSSTHHPSTGEATNCRLKKDIPTTLTPQIPTHNHS